MTATRTIRAASALAICWAGLFALIHAYWGLGGTALLPDGVQVTDNGALLVIDIAAVPLSAVAIGMALMLGGWCQLWPNPRIVWRCVAVGAVVLVVHALPVVPDWLAIAFTDRSLPVDDMTWFGVCVYEPWFMLGGLAFALLATATRPRRAKGRAGLGSWNRLRSEKPVGTDQTARI